MSETSPADRDIPFDASAAQPMAAPRVIPLDERALIAVAGPDAEHFLHNLLTADIAGLESGKGTLAALLTPQGKIIADFLVFDASDEEPLYLIDISRGFVDDFLTKLGLYRLRAKVAIDLLPEPTAVYVVLDGPPITGDDFYTFVDPRDPGLGQRLYGPLTSLQDATCHIKSDKPFFFHTRRVALGIPEGGKDFIALDSYPHEVNFDQLGGVDFSKGCYIGQEIVSRMQHRGTARTRAVLVRFLNGFGVTGGAEIRAGDRLIGHVGECFGDAGIALLRLDKLADAQAAGDAILAGGVAVAISAPLYASFTIPHM